MIHLPSGVKTSLYWRSSLTAICTGQPPVAFTFHTLKRPVRLVEKMMDWPSGDQEAEFTPRVKKRSSTGMGLALGLVGAVTDLGSVIWRSAGPDAKARADRIRTAKRVRLIISDFRFLSSELRSVTANSNAFGGRQRESTRGA